MSINNWMQLPFGTYVTRWCSSGKSVTGRPVTFAEETMQALA